MLNLNNINILSVLFFYIIIFKLKLTQKQLTAYHETGHSVFAWLIGYYSHEVTIKPSKNSLGYEKSDPNLISYMEFGLSKDGTKEAKWKLVEGLFFRIMQYSTGLIAEEIVSEKNKVKFNRKERWVKTPSLPGTDIYEMGSLALSLTKDPNIQLKVQNLATDLTKEWLIEYRDKVEIMFKELFKKDALYKKDIKRILGKSPELRMPEKHLNTISLT